MALKRLDCTEGFKRRDGTEGVKRRDGAEGVKPVSAIAQSLLTSGLRL